MNISNSVYLDADRNIGVKIGIDDNNGLEGDVGAEVRSSDGEGVEQEALNEVGSRYGKSVNKLVKKSTMKFAKELN